MALRTISSYKHVWMTWLGIFFWWKIKLLRTYQLESLFDIEILNLVCVRDLFGLQIPVTTEGFEL